MNLIFKQLFDTESSTFTYVVGDATTKEVAIIDSVHSHTQKYLDLIQANGWSLRYLIETHVHADHVTAVNNLQKKYPEAKAVLGASAAVKYQHKKAEDSEIIHVGNVTIQFFHTPGHTSESVTLYVNQDRILTGDTMFIGSCGRTDFQQGNSTDMFHSLRRLAKLPQETLVYPGHDYNQRFVSSIAEQLLTNKQLRHENIELFKNDVDNWNLPAPKKIKESVPANLVGGIES